MRTGFSVDNAAWKKWKYKTMSGKIVGGGDL